MHFIKCFVNVLKQESEDLEGMAEGHKCQCPMHGRRAIELALGCLGNVIKKLFEASTSAIVLQASTLPTKQQQLLLSDLETARSQVIRLLSQKLKFWTQLPWTLAGVCHWDTALGRAHAQKCIGLFDQLRQRRNSTTLCRGVR